MTQIIRTVGDLEALKKGTTEGPWKVRHDKWGGGLDCSEIMGNEDNLRLAAAAPDLADALIAEKQAHQETLHLVRELWSDVHHHGNVGRASILRHLTRILEATDG